MAIWIPVLGLGVDTHDMMLTKWAERLGHHFAMAAISVPKVAELFGADAEAERNLLSGESADGDDGLPDRAKLAMASMRAAGSRSALWDAAA